MVLTTALIMLGIATCGGGLLWAGHAAIDRWKQRKYLRWRSQWKLIKGGLDDGHCE